MPQASVIIVTRDRLELARRAVISSLGQVGSPEVILIDDASQDGTAEAIRAEFPSVRVHRSAERQGYVIQRNLAVEMSTTQVVFSIDDDAEFSDPNTVQSTLGLFDEPRIGAAAVPFVNCNRDGTENRTMPAVPDDGKLYLSNTFIGTAFAVRRDAFLKIGGFQGRLFHWGEESEFSLRLIKAGYVIGIGAKGMIRHYPGGVGKYSRQVNRYIYRNGLFALWLDAPTIMMPGLLVARLGQNLLHGIRRPKDLLTVLEGCFMALGAILTSWRIRTPLSVKTFKLWLRLRRERPVEFSRVASELPPVRRHSK